MVVNFWRWLMRYQARLNDMGLFLLLMGAFSLVAAFVLFVHRVYFLSDSAVTVGQVAHIESENDSCGSRRSRYDCTRFSALIQYTGQYDVFIMRHGAGSAKKHNRPHSDADYSVGEKVRVRYFVSDPQTVYLDEWFDIFALPIVILMFGALMLLKSSGEQIEDD